jgi:hypothetical protein
MDSAIPPKRHLCASNCASSDCASQLMIDLNRFGKRVRFRLLANVKQVAILSVALVIDQMDDASAIYCRLRLDSAVRRVNEFNLRSLGSYRANTRQ